MVIQPASDPRVERKKKPSGLPGYWIAEIHPNVCAWIERDEPSCRATIKVRGERQSG